MGCRLRWLYLTLSVAFCAGQDAGVPAAATDAIPDGASTLAFVFDVTGSMYDDLVQVIEGASKILETSLSRPKKPLYNFALVPFHDPGSGGCLDIGAKLEIGPVTITTDPKKFQYELRELYVQGGGDCPEMSIGDCDDRTHSGYKAYEEIASTSSGQVFHLDKKQVNEVLKWVEEAVQSSKVHLLSSDHLGGVANTWQLPFDPSLKEVTVSLSGPAPDIEIRNPQGKPVGKSDGLTELLHIPNSAKVFNIKDPHPGTWKPTLDFRQTASRPVQGIPTHILLNTTGLSPPARVDRLELVSVGGKVLKTLPIRYFPDRQPYSLWNITEFIPPNEAFFLRVTGYDPDGFLFQRASSVSFSSIKPAGVEGDWEKISSSEPPPAISVKGNVTASPGSRAVLTCHVISTVSFNLTWLRGGRDARLGPQVNVLDNRSLQLSSVSPDQSGWYECVAMNEGGVTSEQIYLTVQEEPRVSVHPANQTFSRGDEVHMRCSASGYPVPRLVWTHNDMFVKASSRHRMGPDGMLAIRNTEQKDGGVYRCLASNQAGTDATNSVLTYIESPVVTVALGDVLVALGEAAVLACAASGTPQPEIWWYKAAPEFTREPSDTASDIGSNVTLWCLVRGYPDPQVTWRRQDGLPPFNRPRTYGSVTQSRRGLHFTHLWVEDEAVYVCEAHNHFGKIEAKARITVTGLVLPVIARSPSVLSVVEDQPVTLPCVLLAGNPLPARQWLHNYGLVTTDQYVKVRKDGSLHIERVRLDHVGDYTCLAENVVGLYNHTTTLNVYVIPTIQHGPQVFNTIEGTPVTLPCRAIGVPSPEITWTKEGKLLYLGGPDFFLDSDGSLFINSPSGNESGEFICMATNAAGHASRRVQLTVYVRPRSNAEGPGSSAEPLRMSVTEGEDAILPCEVHSVPPPTITWAKERLISPFAPRHHPLPSCSMKILESKVSDSGIYVCVASNIAGNLTLSVLLSVLVPPSIQPGPRVMKVQVGHPVELPCMVSGVPEPTLTWTRDVPPVVEVLEPPFNSPLQERVANQRIAFPCPAKGLPKPVIRWLRNGQELTGNEPGVSILEDGTLLLLASVSPLDSGEYVCAAANDAGSTERKYQLKVNVPPDFTDNEVSRNVSLVLSQSTSLVCDVTGSPSPVITWYKEEMPVVASDNVQILDMGKTLRLLKADPADSGSYSCKAVNIAGSAEKGFFVAVLVPPTIKGSGSSHDTVAMVTQEISLECKVEGLPFPTIQWYKDRKQVFLGDPNLEVTNRGQILRIKSARLGDKARYQCSVMNTAGKESRDFNLSVHVPPTIKGGNASTGVTALLGTVVTLECEGRGVPPPTVTWYRNGQAILSGRQTQYTERGRFLKILRVQATDAGRYTCKAASVVGSTEKTFELDVYLPPTIKGDDAGPTERKVVLSASLILECEAGGRPPPSLTWLKDGVPVRHSQSLRVLELGGKIEISSATLSDSGRYVCVATSVAGEKEVKYDVTVLVPPFIQGAGVITHSTVIINHPLEMECQATGTPTPVVTWYKDGKPIQQGEGWRVAAGGQRLLVSRAQISDTARFQCVAANEAGDIQRDFTVVVHEPPSVPHAGDVINQTILAGFSTQLECKATGTPLPVPPVISSQGGTVTVLVNEPARLECEATGVPSPSFTWLKDGSPVASVPHGLQVLSEGRALSLNSALVTDTGTYTCVAVNAGGEQQREYDLRVYGEFITRL
ncbi:unnamed protein product [Tetraodon nigroviridis]|uniref:(spotted green pufferfish) hypothetical protein n=1 Tax=Tetraodon nigroviridis TaxID=99883 RepID=Q4RJ21_TETNG|nr:unnamed protein product [Tetraodon nigroviridis]